jgi:uncharacterized protein with PQ loop repeat
MALIVQNDYYQYVAIGFASTFMLPQIRLGYQNKSLQEVSSISMVMTFIASSLWAFYMYELELIYYLVPTVFVGLSALSILVLQVLYYYRRMNEQYKSYEQSQNTPQLNCPYHHPTPVDSV